MKRLKTAFANLAIHSAMWVSLYGVVAEGSAGATRLLHAWGWFLILCSLLLLVVIVSPTKIPSTPANFERSLFRVSTSAFIVTCIWHGESFVAGSLFVFFLLSQLVIDTEKGEPA